MKFELKKGEENHVHLEIIKAEFDPKTGKQKFSPFTQVFNKEEFKAFLQFPNGMGLIKVLHLPEGCKTIAEMREEHASKVKGARPVNIQQMSVPSMFDDAEGVEEEEEPDADEPDAIEVKNMSAMKRPELDEYAKQFDINPTEYSNATVLTEAIQMEIDQRGLEA